MRCKEYTGPPDYSIHTQTHDNTAHDTTRMRITEVETEARGQRRQKKEYERREQGRGGNVSHTWAMDLVDDRLFFVKIR